MINSRIFLIGSVALFCNSIQSCADELPQWRDDFYSRVEILALLQTLNVQLLSSKSATVVLENWCADHHMASLSKITARLINDQDKPVSEETRKRLILDVSDRVKYRHVQLSCGSHILSEADNWYVPSRLTDQMNRALNSSDTPFGKIIAPLDPYRTTVETKIYWSPLDKGWENDIGQSKITSQNNKAIKLPKYLFMHRALVSSKSGLPISEVVETYTNEAINFDNRLVYQ